MLKELKDRLKNLFRNLPQRNKPKIIGVDTADGKDQTAITVFADRAAAAGEAMKTALVQFSVDTENMANAILTVTESLRKTIETIERQNTNNWRKMHGLPMRRKRTGQKKRK